MRRWTTVGVVNTYDEARRLKRKMRRKGYHGADVVERWRSNDYEDITVKIKRTGPKGLRFKVIVDKFHKNAPGGK